MKKEGTYKEESTIDWELKLMQILDAVGQAEGVWFETWDGVSADEQAEIEKEYVAYDAGLNRDNRLVTKGEHR